jgi:hypothetical protein
LVLHFDLAEKDLTPQDLCERIAASIELPMDPLDEDDRYSSFTVLCFYLTFRNLELHTYENLNVGYRFKFNKNKFKPRATGGSAKILAIKDVCS